LQVLHVGASDVQPPNCDGDVHCGPVHRTLSHNAAALHVTSHAQDAPHCTPRHELPPEHATLQAPAPHTTLRHELSPVHWMLHDAASRQLTPLRHEFPGEQAISQCQPAGHLTWFEQLVSEQSILQCIEPGSHDVQPGGHPFDESIRWIGLSIGRESRPAPGTMQKPSLQTRPAEQT
jgi:hypothetical protein